MKKILLFLPLLFVIALIAFLTTDSESLYKKTFDTEVVEIITPLEEKIGQLFVIGHWGETPTETTSQRIKDLHLGGVIIMSVPGNEQKVSGWSTRWQEIAYPTPLLVGIDQEGGVVSRLKGDNFPQVAQPDITSTEQAYVVASDRAETLTNLGINLNYAPVVDRSVRPDSFMHDRVFRDPGMIASLSDATVRGYQHNNVLAAPKHFPGHPDSADDSHLTLPKLEISMSEYELHTKQFTDLIAGGNTYLLMTAHVLVPTLDPNFPATVSPIVINDLRTRIGYDGIIITDDLAMQAISDRWSYEESAVLALNAGADMIMLAAEPEFASSTIAAVIDAVVAGDLSEDRIDEAYARVLEVKNRF